MQFGNHFTSAKAVAQVPEMRSHFPFCVAHARLPTALAELQAGWEIWQQFALEAGVIGAEEQVELTQRGSMALSELAALQAPYQR